MRDALNKTGVHVLLSTHGIADLETAPALANSWRTTPDDDPELLNSLAPRAFLNNEFANLSQPGAYNDPDMVS